MPSLIFVAAILIAVLATSFISGTLGMAGGMMLMGVLLALLPLPAAMMLHGITQMASNGWRAWLWRRYVDWRVFKGYACGALLALALFATINLVVIKAQALIILGLTPFLGMALPARLALNVDSRGHPLACGVICSSLQLLAGVSGPLLDVFFVRSKMDRRGVVATKAMSQTLSHLIKLLYFGAVVASAESAVSVQLALACVALALVGTTLSRKVLEGMDDSSFRKWTRWTVMSMGMFYLASGAWMLVTG